MDSLKAVESITQMMSDYAGKVLRARRPFMRLEA